MENNTYTIEQVKNLAIELAKNLEPNTVLALYGDLGSGKTTFTNFLVHALGFDDRVQSPTFVLLRKYSRSNGSDGPIRTVNHLDLYRLNGATEIHELGLKEIIEEPGVVTVIEWPEIAETFLPKNTKSISFEVLDDETRKITLHNKN